MGHGAWHVTRYADVVEVLSSPHRFTSLRGTGEASRHDAEPPGWVPPFRSLNMSDGAEHGALRSMVVRALGELDPRWCRARAHELLAPLRAGQLLDGAAVGDRLALEVFARVMGLSEDEAASARVILHRIARGGEGAVEAWRQAELEQHELIRTLMERRQGAPATGALGALMGLPLAGRDLHFLLRLVFETGHHTTGLAISGALWAVAERPEARAALARGVALRPAVDELLRFTSPVLRFGRFCVADTCVGGQAISAGTRVVARLAEANRDPLVFAAPDELELTRAPNPHVAFGVGPHACLGAPLARAAVGAVVEELRGLPLRLAGPVRWLDSRVNHGPVELPIRADGDAGHG